MKPGSLRWLRPASRRLGIEIDSGRVHGVVVLREPLDDWDGKRSDRLVVGQREQCSRHPWDSASEALKGCETNG